MLPGIDGLAVCRDIRTHDATIPIIMLTALAGTRDVVVGLEIGADDYITNHSTPTSYWRESKRFCVVERRWRRVRRRRL